MDMRFKIDGMHCGGCVNAVQRVLQGDPSVTAVSVDLKTGRASIETSADVDPARFISALEEAGYEARIET